MNRNAVILVLVLASAIAVAISHVDVIAISHITHAVNHVLVAAR